ncbi:MAG TPA: ThuA domain-containing protein, partial [Clostridiales bacterium]|nr:ThuA domain-containing protein [Clostridiales bacterium]
GGSTMINITIWNESGHKGRAYPEGMNAALASIFQDKARFNVDCALLGDEAQGFPGERLEHTDVLFWWGHSKHEKVSDELSERICARVREGMGAVFLHSAHFSKPFRSLMGTTCSLSWREAPGECERIWITNPYHPVARGITNGFRLDREEMYGEYFDIPKPDDVVFTGWFTGGEVFRSGCAFERGKGRIFYFQPGHESFPIYRDENIRSIILNAALWAARADEGLVDFVPDGSCPHVRVSPEPIRAWSLRRIRLKK